MHSKLVQLKYMKTTLMYSIILKFIRKITWLMGVDYNVQSVTPQLWTWVVWWMWKCFLICIENKFELSSKIMFNFEFSRKCNERLNANRATSANLWELCILRFATVLLLTQSKLWTSFNTSSIHWIDKRKYL